jgi:hypothetical protein
MLSRIGRGPQIDDLPACFEHFEMIGPPLRHFNALRPKGPARISAADRVRILMRQGPLYGVSGKLTAFVQQS